ncbi:Rrf2 family transcriptional regulator [Methyloligella solikamskensis]|uniref:Rrf2 family transcriptional regulator n=1 Tax=Methyloligella solikamskensis TaxID=1177756 RepID=A0ABW3J8B1_9HYPH
MRLTTFSDYCLRILIFVGVHDDRLCTIDEICTAYGISRGHVMKAVYRLGQLGYLDTLRGKNGGIRLAKEPSDIGVGDLIRHTEEDMALVECFQAPGSGRCCIVGSCILRVALAKALDEFLCALDRYTLADLLGPRDRLAALLSLDRKVPGRKSSVTN